MKEMHNPEVVIEDGLIKVNENSAPLLFSSVDSINNIVGLIRNEVSGHEPDLSTAKGRKAIASLAMKVSKSKVILDGLGKDLVADWKQRAKVVDQARKVARDDLDDLRDEVRQPLTDWEKEEERKAQEELDRIKKEQDHGDALRDNELFDLRREKEAREAEEAAAREEQERLQREEQIRQDAFEMAERKNNEEIRRVQEEADRKAQEEKDRIERERLEEARKVRLQQEADETRAANLRRQGQVNRVAAEDLSKVLDVDYESAKLIVAAIAKGLVRGISIQY